MPSSYVDYVKEQARIGNVFPIEIQETSNILRNISSLIYEFKDSTVEIKTTENGVKGVYTKSISPLFYDRVINDPNNYNIISIIGEMVPYYYLEPDNNIQSLDDTLLKETRDPGINDVPSPLQNSDFYETWFRDTWGFIQNSLILSTYNKLRYPFINENQYLNINLFSYLSNETFSYEGGTDSESYIGFMDTEEENDEANDPNNEYYGEEIGCLDFIDDIVNQKILGSYSIIDYANKQNVILNKWGESLFVSGQLSREEVDTSKTIFKLQDIKNELLRRKFAGSRTLYDLAMETLNRQGSFVTSIKYYDLPASLASKKEYYNNKRSIRVLKIPGIISKPYNFENKLGLDLFKVYLEKDVMPINTMIPLFYTSAELWNSNNNTDSIKFDSEKFFSGSSPDPSNIKNYTSVPESGLVTYQSNFLRDNSNSIDWSSLDGIILSNNIKEKYEILDRLIGEERDPETGELIKFYRKLDETYSEYSVEEAKKYLDKDYRDYSIKIRLDIESKLMDLDLVSGSVADVNADKILYHCNSIQELVGENYPYVRYPIAGNNGPSLIDTYWLNYIENEVRAKSKVQDNTEIGTQLNTVLDLGSEGSSESLNSGKYYFFGISFTDKDYSCLIDDSSSNEDNSDENKSPYFKDIEIRDYKEGDKYALLWYCVVTYEAESLKFKVTGLEKTLVTKIALRTDKDKVSSRFKEGGDLDGAIIDECREYVYANVGIIPFTYSTAIDDKIWETKLGFYGEGDSQKFISDDITKLGYSKAYFLFSDYDIIKNCSDINKAPIKNSGTKISGYNDDLVYCSSSPSTETKTVYYMVNRTSIEQHQKVEKSGSSGSSEDSYTLVYDDNGQAVIETSVVNNYYWSDPIRVVHITDEYLSKLEKSNFEPEWEGLGYFYNAYLNFTLNSASPLRHKKIIPSNAFLNFSKKLQIEAAGGEDNIIYEAGEAKYILNPGEYAALSNLNRVRGMDYVCADGPNNINRLFPTLWTDEFGAGHPSRSIEGMYLTRVCPSLDVPGNAINKSEDNREYSSIFGDNRYQDAFDSSFSQTIVYIGIDDIKDINPPSTIEEKSALYLVSFISNIYDYKYYYWDDEKYSFQPVDFSSTENRSKLYQDDMGMKGLKISSFNNLGKRESGVWWPNFFAMHPSQKVFPWYWNSNDPLGNPSNGKTIFFNIRVDEDCVDTGFVLFSSRASDSTETLRLEATEDGRFKFTVFNVVSNDENGNENCEIVSDVVLTKDIPEEKDAEGRITKEGIKGSISLRNFRIAASFIDVGENKYKAYLIINNDIYKSNEFSYNIENSNSSVIYLFSDYSGTESWEGHLWRGDDSWTQSDMFYGTIYDMRLYNRGKTLEALQLLNTGSFRETFSYSSSNFKLANSLYRDSTVLRIVNTTKSEDSNKLPEVNSIRIFDRSIWDSIMLDNCSITLFETSTGSPQYREDYENPVSDTDIYKPVSSSLGGLGYVLNNCVEQEMVENIEVFNGLSDNITSEGSVLISYQSAAKRKDISLDKSYFLTLVTTLIEPENYENESLKSSHLKFELLHRVGESYIHQNVNTAIEELSNPIYIPIQTDSTDDYFIYSADVNFNFRVFSEFDISKWLSKGNNVQLEYNSSLDKAVARLSDISLRDSESNSVVLPFIVPSTVEADAQPGDLSMDRFYAKNVVLSNSLAAFLNASSYYNEIQIPVAVEEETTTYTELDKTAYIQTKDFNPQPNKTYFFTDKEDGIIDTEDSDTHIFRLPSRTDFTGDYFTKSDEFKDLYELDFKTCVKTSVDGNIKYLQISTGEYYDDLADGRKTIQVLDGEVWEELQPDDLYFYDGLTYRYSDESQISHNQPDTDRLVIYPNSIYRKYSYPYTDELRYSLCLYRYDITRDYYTLYSQYDAMTENEFVSGTQYYEYIDDTGTYQKASFVSEDSTVYNTIFDSAKRYYEDYLTENTYYCKNNNNEYVYTNVAYPSVTTFAEWYEDESRGPIYLSNTNISSIYYNKWDAVRVMKEGTYYFTCKYPMQILPFTDDAFDSSPEINYTTYYASCRFKVVVKGTPKEFEDKNIVEGYPKKYWADVIDTTLKSSDQRYLPDDNRTFPHREMRIDLYVMNIQGIAGKMETYDPSQEAYSYKWVRVATNDPESLNPETESSVKILDRETVESQITIESNIPFFLEKNYVAPFFIAKYNKATGIFTADPESADDDIIDPIGVSNNPEDEFITSNYEYEMDTQMLVSGKSYKVLFEYTGKVTEISFTDNIYDSVTFEDGSPEKVNFSRLVNLLDTDTLDVSEYMYNTDGQSFIKNKYRIVNYNSGFKTTDSGWDDITVIPTVPTDIKFSCFGNPYSRSSSLNYLLSIRNSSLDTVSSIRRINSRQNINNSYCFPYMVQQNDSNTIIPAFLSKLGVVVDETGVLNLLDFDELGVVKTHYNDIRGKMVSAINALKTQSCGLFMGLSEFKPVFRGTKENSYERINYKDYELFGYMASSRSLKVRNDRIFMERRNLYSNNLLSNNAFENRADWVLTGASSYGYVSDNNWGSGETRGKDVFQITPTSAGVIKLKYSTGDLAVKSRYEVAININRSLGNGKVKAQFYSGNKAVGNKISLSRSSKAICTGWYNYSAETPDIIVADSVEFIINYGSVFCITKAVIRKCNTVSQYSGLSNALNQVTSATSESKIISLGHSMVVYRNKETGEYFPVQFNNEIMNTVSSNGKSVKRPKSGLSRANKFISNYSLESYGENSKLIKLFSPWLRRLYYISNGEVSESKCEVHGYGIRANSLGKKEIIEIYNNVSDIFDTSGTPIVATKDESNSRYNLMISDLPIKLDEKNCISAFNMNLAIDGEDPISLSSERFSTLFNCLEPSRYRNNKDYSVAVTNIQLLAKKPGVTSPKSYEKNKIVYELEYLPIIYNERSNHLSLNLLLYRK